MMHLVHSELRKLTTGRTVAVLTILGLLLVVASASFGLFATDLVGPFIGTERQVADAVGSLGGNVVMVLIVGVLSVTTEFRHGTLGRTLQLEPSRTRVLVAKLFAAVTYALAFYMLALTVVGVMLLVAAASNDVALTWGPLVARGLRQGPVGFALNAMLGVAIGALLRSQVIAITVTLVWLFIVESLVGLLSPGAARFLPFQALAALFLEPDLALVVDGGGGGFSFATQALDPPLALAMFLAYVTVACAAAGVHLTRGDV
jgi:ABC-2 type transport system permease protein